jgi:hypothetical protein
MADDKKQTPPPAPSRDVEKQDRPGRTLDETVRRPPSRPFNDTVSDTLKPPPPPDKK